MAANTVSAWTFPKTIGKCLVTSCTVLVDTANQMAWTKKTPPEIDCTKPMTLQVSASGAVDGQAVPLDLYIGYADNSALAGTSAITATAASKYKQLVDDIGYAGTLWTNVHSIALNPDQQVADVVTIAAEATGLKTKTTRAPFFLFNLNGATTLLAETVTFRIIQ